MAIAYQDAIKQLSALMDEVDERLKSTFQNMHQGYPNETLARFLKAREWNVSKAHRMLVDCLNWRIENEIDNMLSKPIVPADTYRGVRESQLIGLSGYSKEGLPVYAIGSGLSTFDKASVHYHVQSHIQMNEYRDRVILPAATRKSGRHIGTCIKVLDMTGLKLSALSQIKILTMISTIDDLNYPEKTEAYAAEYEKRKENFMKEFDFVIADVIMAIVADFMLVWLPALTVSLKPPLAFSAGPVSKFFYSCPDNAFQIALSGTSYSVLQRVGAVVRNGAKLFVVGTGASLIGTGVTNALILARKAVNKNYADEAEDVPILSTSVAYGVYMAVSSNLRYQILAGVIEQRFLEPLLHNHKLVLSAICFAVRTGNTFLGSLMWVDYARFVGIQKARE